MKSRTKHNERRITQICAVISACMLIVLGLPACTGGALPSARSTVQNETSAVRQEINVTSTPEPLVFGDETSKNLPVEQNDEMAGACSEALYIEEPNASGYVPVVEGLWLLCNKLQADCVDSCIKGLPAKKRKDKNEQRLCEKKCLAEYMICLERAGLVKKVFSAFDAAWEWIKGHKAEIAGTIIVVGGVAYLVSTGGSGALVLIPLGV
jgi:hypothetical protein